MKVNMTPNPLDVVTIHASQGDTEARQWEFELHNNGELIDTSEITEQLFFKAYKGGTEQILPENTSTPTTSPFKGDIKYPQGLLTDQEFLYRQSPTEEDGLAKITDIKGNTLVWNQLVGTNVNGLTTTQGTTFSLNSSGSIHVTGTGTGNHFCEWRTYENPSFVMVKGHKYLAAFKGLTNGIIAQVSVYTTASTYILNKIDLVGSYAEIVTPTQDGITSSLVRFYTTNTFSGTTDITMQLFDLTQMGLDISSPSEFTSLFPLPYYAYNQGTLLSFNGNGIKTVGKNQSQLVSMSTISGGYINASSGDIATVKKGITYTLSFDNLTSSTANIVARMLVDGAWIRQGENNLVANSRWALTFTATDDGVLGLSAGLGSQYSEVKVFDNIQLEFGSTASDYESYTSSTLSLPISTYFPNGMKSAGTAYDELTPTKAITKVGSVDLGSLSQFYYSPPTSDKPIAQFSAILPNALSNVNTNVRCALYTASSSPVYGRTDDKTVCTFNGRVYICDSAYTDSTAFKTAMSGVYLYYELATPTETSFTTASLVTENAEIPLSNEDGILIGKCTEQLSSESGFFDAKIKLADTDGECYSNKLQLHVERSPQ